MAFVQILQSDLYCPLLHEMQLDEHMQADPTLLPFVVFMLVQATGVYAMQLVPSTDSYPAVHSHDTPETPCVQTAFSPQLPLLTSQERNNVLVVSVVDVDDNKVIVLDTVLVLAACVDVLNCTSHVVPSYPAAQLQLNAFGRA